MSCALLETPASGPTPTALAFPSVIPPNNATTFDVNSLIGQPAPPFTLPDASGQLYNFHPNDGRKHLIAFYMVYTWGSCVHQLGELEKNIADLRPLADVVAVGNDSATSIQQTQATTKASFPLLRDSTLAVAKQYDMQLRGDWPMGMMGAYPEMGYVIVDAKGVIRTQRVDLNFGDNIAKILVLLKQ